MGVSGSGKTTIGQQLSMRTGYPFYDADNFHTNENKKKMNAGIPLTDEEIKKIPDEMKVARAGSCFDVAAPWWEGDDFRVKWWDGGDPPFNSPPVHSCCDAPVKPADRTVTQFSRRRGGEPA